MSAFGANALAELSEQLLVGDSRGIIVVVEWGRIIVVDHERRQRFSETHRGEPLGSFDAGIHWQEANAHAAYLIGLCNVLEYRGTAIATGVWPHARDAGRLDAQALGFAGFFNDAVFVSVTEGNLQWTPVGPFK